VGKWNLKMPIQRHHQPGELDYRSFQQLNDLVFPHEPVSEVIFQSFLTADFWTATHGKHLVGYAVLSTHEENAHIHRIGVHPEYRSRGLGSQLMEIMLDSARALGAATMDLMVQQDNPAAIHLYHKYKFQITGESIQFLTTIPKIAAGDYAILPLDAVLARGSQLSRQPWLLDWTGRHKPPHQWVLVFFQGDRLVGFTRFSPDFPGCSPFVLFTEDLDLRSLVSLLDGYAQPGKRIIKVTTEDPYAIAGFTAAGAQENYRLYRMVRPRV